MAEKSSRLAGAQEAQEAQVDMSRSPEVKPLTEKENRSLGERNETINYAKGISLRNRNVTGSLQDAEDYVASVMCSQPVMTVLQTPSSSMASGRKRHLSMPAVGGTDYKKIRSDTNNINDVVQNDGTNSITDESEEDKNSTGTVANRPVA